MLKPLISVAALAVLGAGAAALAEPIAPDAVVITDMAVATSLTGVPGDPAKGREVFLGRSLGNCLACHANSEMAGEPFHGEVGPPLDGVASRWGEAELRAIIVNSKAVFGEETVMPAFYRSAGFARVREEFQGKTILTAEQVEDVVAYLMTLSE